MRNLSVTTFIHILFSVAILILIATFLLFLSWDKDRHKIEEYKRYQLISITFLSKLQLNPGKEDLDALYKDLRVKPLSQKKSIEIKKQIEKILLISLHNISYATQYFTFIYPFCYQSLRKFNRLWKS